MSFVSEESTQDEIIIVKENQYSISSTVSKILQSIIFRTENCLNLEELKKNKTSFDLEEAPEISIEDYLNRIIYYTNVENSTIINALIYIDRLCSLGGIVLTMNNIHLLIFISIYESIKYNEDKHYKLNYYAQIAGVSNEKLLCLEREYLILIEYKLFVDENLFFIYQKYLQREQ